MEPYDWTVVVTQMIAADPQAVSQFMIFFSELLRREYLARRIPSDIAEDLAIECTYRLASRIHQFDRSRGTLEGWVRSSGLNALRDWFRAHHDENTIPYLDNLPYPLSYRGQRADESTQLVVQQALLHLSATDQRIMEMRFREDLTHCQIAEALRMSHDSVRQHYVRALSRLEKLLKRDEQIQARILRARRTAACS